jgi:hypothetical protein
MRRDRERHRRGDERLNQREPAVECCWRAGCLELIATDRQEDERAVEDT